MVNFKIYDVTYWITNLCPISQEVKGPDSQNGSVNRIQNEEYFYWKITTQNMVEKLVPVLFI